MSSLEKQKSVVCVHLLNFRYCDYQCFIYIYKCQEEEEEKKEEVEAGGGGVLVYMTCTFHQPSMLCSNSWLVESDSSMISAPKSKIWGLKSAFIWWGMVHNYFSILHFNSRISSTHKIHKRFYGERNRFYCKISNEDPLIKYQMNEYH